MVIGHADADQGTDRLRFKRWAGTLRASAQHALQDLDGVSKRFVKNGMRGSRFCVRPTLWEVEHLLPRRVHPRDPHRTLYNFLEHALCSLDEGGILLFTLRTWNESMSL